MFIYKHNQANLQTNTWPKLRLVVRFESIRKFKLKRNDWLQERVNKQPIIALYFEFENVLKFYNLGAFAIQLRHFSSLE